jgi:ribose transport system substrate-binding protein
MKRWIPLLIVPVLALAGCGGGGGTESKSKTIRPASDPENVKVAYVTNGIDPFWTIAEAGAKAGAKEFNVDCEVLMPPKGITDQKRMIESLLANGIDGVAVSPIDAANQVSFLNTVAGQTNLITQDSDAPNCDRLCFIGMNNYDAGREAGKMVKDALPQGGEIMIFVGRLEQLNAQQRRQGVIDELMDRPMQTVETMKSDPFADKIVGDKFTVLGTMTDSFEMSKAKANAEDSMAANENLAGMVGLFAYNMPACLEAVKGAGKLGKIKLVSFDEADNTLQGIIDGHVQGTVSQQPYVYGYESVRVLAALARGDESVLPEGGFLKIDSINVTKENVEEFWANLKKLKGED